MVNKKEHEDAEKKARLLALVQSGAEYFRGQHAESSVPEEAAAPPVTRPEAVKAPPAPAPERPSNAARPAALPPRPAASLEDDEAAVFGPEMPEDPARYLVKRRRSLREDPEWVGTTLYIRRETHGALQEFCRGAGLDMSRVVQYCVAIQMDESRRSPILSRLLAE